jgi:hypothetical protein
MEPLPWSRLRDHNGRFIKRQKTDEEKEYILERIRFQKREYGKRNRAQRRAERHNDNKSFDIAIKNWIKVERRRMQNLEAARRYREKYRDKIKLRRSERRKNKLINKGTTIVAVSLNSLESALPEQGVADQLKIFRPWE